MTRFRTNQAPQTSGGEEWLRSGCITNAQCASHHHAFAGERLPPFWR